MTGVITEIEGEQLEFLGDRAIWWPARRTLLIADLHLGKASAFRASGIPVPENVTSADLSRLTSALERTGVERLVILGDLLHARRGRSEATMNAFAAWRRQHSSVEILLIRGNHDRRAGDPPGQWEITCAEEGLVDEPFVYAHEPISHERGLVLCGHLHPAIVLRGSAGSSLRSPCFWVREKERMIVLPAFGTFTGMKAIKAGQGDRVYAVGEDRVLEIKPSSAHSSMA